MSRERNFVYRCFSWPHCRGKRKVRLAERDYLFEYLDPAHYQRCPVCGCFMVPKAVMKEEPVLTSRHFGKFSRCENAFSCHQEERYSAVCENNVLMPKCLNHLFWSIKRLLKECGLEQKPNHVQQSEP